MNNVKELRRQVIDLRQVVPYIISAVPAHINMVIERREIITVSIGNNGMSGLGIIFNNTEDHWITRIEVGVDHIIQRLAADSAIFFPAAHGIAVHESTQQRTPCVSQVGTRCLILIFRLRRHARIIAKRPDGLSLLRRRTAVGFKLHQRPLIRPALAVTAARICIFRNIIDLNLKPLTAYTRPAAGIFMIPHNLRHGRRGTPAGVVIGSIIVEAILAARGRLAPFTFYERLDSNIRNRIDPQ